MQKVNSLQAKWRNVVFFFTTALLLVAADQLSKFWIRSNLAIGESLFEVGFFRLTYVRNTGAAFGLFQGQSLPLTIVASVGVAALLLYVFFFYRKLPFLNNRLGKLALGLVLGGTVGNLIDRIYLGYVTDFIAVSIWPAFNIADPAIVVGTIILAYSLIGLATARKQ
jgi:signal peptidase II